MERTITKVPTLPKLARKKRVAAYTRVSCGKDAMMHSLSAQISYYSDLIQKQSGWQYVGVYSDEAVTGTKETREGFQRLLHDCRSGKVDMIITKSISRFARNTVMLLNTVRELKSLEVDVFFEEQNLHSLSGDGELMLTILASYAQEESRSVSENCKWRIRNQFKQGEPTWFKTYGYRMCNGRLEIHEPEARVVRYIFRLYLLGNGMEAIINHLQQLGVRAPEGNIWYKNTVAYILTNERYVGDLLLQKTFIEDHLTKRRRVNTGEVPQYFVEGTHEAIIDLATFMEVQKLLAKNRVRFHPNRQERTRYLFSGMLECGNCGAKYRRKITMSGTKYSKPVWICTTYNIRGKAYCASKQIPDEILTAVTANVLGYKEINREILEGELEKILVSGQNELTFLLKDGTERVVEWEDHSRSESWSTEMRHEASEKMKRRSAS